MKPISNMPTFFSLFSGIGGIDLAFQLAGFQIAGQVEIATYCQKVLAKNFPSTPRWCDIRKVGADEILSTTDGIIPNVIGGGFPCQDISFSNNKGQGLSGERSGLWREFARLIGELRPRYVFVENVPAITHRGGIEVVGNLAALGYDAEWAVIPASAVGAPHRRERFWLVGYPRSHRQQRSLCVQPNRNEKWDTAPFGEKRATVFHAAFANGQVLSDSPSQRYKKGCYAISTQTEIAVTDCDYPRWHGTGDECRMVGRSDGLSTRMDGFRLDFPAPPNQPPHHWEAPRTVAKGTIANWSKRVESLGNAVVPQAVLPIAQAIYKELRLEVA